jgi:hypothetical protein
MRRASTSLRIRKQQKKVGPTLGCEHIHIATATNTTSPGPQRTPVFGFLEFKTKFEIVFVVSQSPEIS